MMWIDAQGQQQGIEGHLHHPGGGESIAHLPVSHANYINALRQPLKQGCDGATHPSLPISMCRSSPANLGVSGGSRGRSLIPTSVAPEGCGQAQYNVRTSERSHRGLCNMLATAFGGRH